MKILHCAVRKFGMFAHKQNVNYPKNVDIGPLKAQ